MLNSQSRRSPNVDQPVSLQSTLDLLMLIGRRRVPLLLGLACGIVLGALYYLQATPMYESTAEVLVLKKRPAVVTGEQRYESHFEDYVSTHLVLIVSPLIVERAIESYGLSSLNTFSDIEAEYLVDAVIERLEVDSGPRNLGDSAESIMNLTFTGPDPEECPIVVQAVLDSYSAFLDETYRGMSSDTEELISQARDLLSNDLQKQEEAYAHFRQFSPLVSRGPDEINPLQDRLVAIETQRSQWLLRRIEVERQLKALEQAMQSGIDSERLLAIVADLRQQVTSEVTLPGTSASLDNQLFALMDQERKLVEHYGTNHPHIVSLRRQIANTRRYYTVPTAVHMANRSTPESADLPESNPADAYFEYLKQELERIRISEELCSAVYEQQHEAAKELSSFQLKDERFQRNIDRTQQLYDGVISQLQEAGLIGDYGGFEARTIGPPRVGEKVSPSGRLALLGALLVGGLIGLALALFTEASDTTFHSREEIQAHLRLPVVGQIPQFDDASMANTATGKPPLDPALCAYFQPRSLVSEAYRALRASLCFAQHSAAARVIQLTGPGPGEGVSTITANLAVSIAQSGRRVLLIDADLQKPRQHLMFGLSAQTGLTSIVTQDHELQDVIQQTAVNKLWLLPAGPASPESSELFMSPSFSELIQTVREMYDYVLIDTGPLLVLSDPCELAAQVDGVLLALKLDKLSRRRAKGAREILEPLAARLLGVVVNGIDEVGTLSDRNELRRLHAGYYQGVANDDQRNVTRQST